jgi:hypothetical protein
MLLLLTALASTLTAPCPDSLVTSFAQRDAPAGVGRCVEADTTPARKRVKAVQLSDAYETRLAIHKWASYATVPLFTAQAIIGEQLFNIEQAGNKAPKGLRDAHDLLALGVGALFAANTYTGALNWWETRSQTDGRTWRTIHAALMLASDAGFAYTALLGTNARRLEASRIQHRNWATASASAALVSYIMMLKPFRRD